MLLKVFVLAFICLIHLQAYSQQNGVLILTDDDLANITEVFPHLFIKYYVPWCRHCKQLAPIFQEIAQDLQAQNSSIRLAKIDCDENSKAFSFQNIEHFPTLVFYNHGSPLNFDGDRTKDYLSKWLTKRLVSPIKEITLEQLEHMRKSQGREVALIFHGDLQSVKGATFTNVAYQDNYNNYYFIKQSTKPFGTVELFRSFSQDVEYPYPDDSFQYWISEHDRPSVVPLDDRSISSVFRDGRQGVFLFLQDKYSGKLSEFKSAADAWKGFSGNRRLNFILVPEDHEDYYGLLEYMDVNPLETPLVIIDAESQEKYIMNVTVNDLSNQNIVDFLNQFDAGKVTSTPLESQHAHHHHDHDHQHDHHHHHHDHHHHHHHHDQHSNEDDHNHHHHHHHDHHDHHHEHSHHNHDQHSDCGHHHYEHDHNHQDHQNHEHQHKDQGVPIHQQQERTVEATVSQNQL